MPFQEVVEAEGHLIDSHIMEQDLRQGGRSTTADSKWSSSASARTNSEPSYLRLKVETPDAADMEQLLEPAARCWAALRPIPATRDLGTVERDCCAPEDFYSTTNHQTLRALRTATGSKWRTSAWTRMIVVRRRTRLLPPAARSAAGDRIVVGHARHPRHARIEGARPAGVRLHVATEFRRERQVETAVRQTAALVRHAIEQKARKSSWWPDRWWSTPAAWPAWRR